MKNAFFCFPVLPGSAKYKLFEAAHYSVFRLLNSSVIFLPKNIIMCSRVSKLWQAKGGTFFETQCSFILFYKSMVQPYLQDANFVLCPYKQYGIKELENKSKKGYQGSNQLKKMPYKEDNALKATYQLYTVSQKMSLLCFAITLTYMNQF